MKYHDVVIIGAGPYGLSAAAHLRHAGVEPYVIGQSMSFWRQNMPSGMFLRSRVEASDIHAPERRLSIFGYQKAMRRRLPEPLPIEDFVAYGDWLQQQVAPNLDRRQVQSVARNGHGFHVHLADGDRVSAKAVVLTVGIGLFQQRPPAFAEIPRELAPHSSDFTEPARFAGKHVAVIGHGQSALEYTALLHEAGAHVQILTRAKALTFLSFAWRKHLFRKLTPGPLRPISYRILPPTDLGDIRTARTMADPNKFRRQPPEIQRALLKDVTTPRGAYWLPQRLAGVPVHTGVSVAGAERHGDRVTLTLSDGTTRSVDSVLLATGYRIDVAKCSLIAESLRREIRTQDGYPALSTGLETSVKGLYMAGVIAERTLGPTLRFVTGTSNAGPRLAAAISRNGDQ
jgi:cation diffusion facilitator CzcD-associated flavoprotein CzcO